MASESAEPRSRPRIFLIQDGTLPPGKAGGRGSTASPGAERNYVARLFADSEPSRPPSAAGGSAVEFLAVEPDGRVQLPWSIGGKKDEFRGFAETLAAGVPDALVYETPKQWNVGNAERKPLRLLQVLGSTKALRSALEALHAALQPPD